MTYHWRGENAQDRVDRARHLTGNRRSYGVMSLDSPDAFDPDREEAKRHGIGGNNAPRYDPEAPVTGFPGVMRDIEAFQVGDGTEISSRSKLREFQKERGVEQVGVEHTACSKVGKPEWYSDYTDHRKERTKAKAKGKADPGTWSERMKRDGVKQVAKPKWKDGKKQW